TLADRVRSGRKTSTGMLCDKSRQPRRATLFPYTTLFRSREQGVELTEHAAREYVGRGAGLVDRQPGDTVGITLDPPGSRRRVIRSEEHTSELQSLAYLVCRLLLEKKNALRPHMRPLPDSP